MGNLYFLSRLSLTRYLSHFLDFSLPFYDGLFVIQVVIFRQPSKYKKPPRLFLTPKITSLRFIRFHLKLQDFHEFWLKSGKSCLQIGWKLSATYFQSGMEFVKRNHFVIFANPTLDQNFLNFNNQDSKISSDTLAYQSKEDCLDWFNNIHPWRCRQTTPRNL